MLHMLSLQCMRDLSLSRDRHLPSLNRTKGLRPSPIYILNQDHLVMIIGILKWLEKGKTIIIIISLTKSNPVEWACLRSAACRAGPQGPNSSLSTVTEEQVASSVALPNSNTLVLNSNKLCGWPPQYAPPPATWPLTFWPWKWCLSHVWRGLPLCQF